MLTRILAAVGLMALAFQADAVPIRVTQTISSVTWHDYGVAGGVGYGQTPVGDWIFSATVDSEALDLVADLDIGVFAVTDATLTQASLGLDEVGITNLSYLWFYPNNFGFSENIYGGAPWTRITYEPNHFVSAQTLDEYLALTTVPPAPFDSGFGPQWEGFALADGRRLYGWGFGSGTTAVSSVSVPEPGVASLFLSALGALALRMRRRAR